MTPDDSRESGPDDPPEGDSGAGGDPPPQSAAPPPGSIPTARLLVFWSDSAMPLAEEIRRRLDEDLRIQDSSESEGALWSLVIEGLPLPGPVEVRVTPRLEDLPTASSETVRWRDRLERRRAERASWFLSVEAPLDASAPQASWQELLRVALRLCEDTPAVFDLSSCRLRAGSEIERLTSRNLEREKKEK